MHDSPIAREAFLISFALFLLATSVTASASNASGVITAAVTSGRTPTSATVAAENSSADSLQSLVQAEKNFAQTSVEQGIRDAFLAYLADNGIVFNPGPVNGKELYHKRPASDAQLTWQPVFADIARAADMGYTTGPWEFKRNKGDQKPAAYGQFLSVWKKQNDGTWKVVLDGGIDTPAPVNKESPAEIIPNEFASQDEHNLKTARRALAHAEEEFNTASEKDAGAALIDVAAPNIRVFRNNRFPAVGRDAAQLMISYDHGKLKAKATGSGISCSGDLAYTYGQYANERLDGIEHGHFITIWRMSIGGDWQLAIDLRKQDPLAVPNKKPDRQPK